MSSRDAMLRYYMIAYREEGMSAEARPLLALFQAEDREHALEQMKDFLPDAVIEGSFTTGDEVYWEDPDDGICSGARKILDFRVSGGQYVLVLEDDLGGVTEVLPSETGFLGGSASPGAGAPVPEMEP